ncbi:MAG: YegS/Rv2252/BmrU family lipid kinase [Kaiparowitsia implicata GSE-PSE-MK54-09C]|jgi:YegS/Rv2252/BmrU family lipid kinase|nr:YegS/Rv2252/BmrU family lipid kinase [Kaiparowitsia implicata GSE-PSE-MK54-09C]
MSAAIALFAHPSQFDTLLGFVRQHKPVLMRYRLLATAEIGQQLREALGLSVEQVASVEQGGALQLAAAVVSGQVTLVVALLDPSAVTGLDGEPLLRACALHNVALATNLATAEAIATHLAQSRVAHLIFNPVAGRGIGEQDLVLIQQELSPHLHLETHITDATTQIDALVQAAVAAQADVVIASGGDGTVSEVARCLAGTQVPLGVIARGTANAFATSLSIPSAIAPLPAPIRDACQVILAGKTRTIDVATSNGQVFTLLAAIGYEAETVERATRELKNRWGALAYLLAGWQQLNEENLFDVEIEVNGEVRQLEAGAITIANAAPPTSILAQGAGEVVCDDGKLDVTIASADSKLQAIQTMFGMLGSAMVKANRDPNQPEAAMRELPNVVHLYVERIKVTTNPPQKVVIDGDPVGTTPIEVSCIPGALNVLVP